MVINRKPIAVGTVFGKLTVIEDVGKQPPSQRYSYRCRCDCGKSTIITQDHLRRAVVKSCGCARTKHGQYKTSTYSIWSHMLARCNNPNHQAYKDYGGRGIKVCPRWSRFENFFTDMGSRPNGLSLDRINNEEDYTPGNCKWSSPTQQANNRRNSRMIEFNGDVLTIMQWSERLHMPATALYVRLTKLNWLAERALTTPVKYKRLPPTT
jgi:hypothetical protein